MTERENLSNLYVYQWCVVHLRLHKRSLICSRKNKSRDKPSPPRGTRAQTLRHWEYDQYTRLISAARLSSVHLWMLTGSVASLFPFTALSPHPPPAPLHPPTPLVTALCLTSTLPLPASLPQTGQRQINNQCGWAVISVQGRPYQARLNGVWWKFLETWSSLRKGDKSETALYQNIKWVDANTIHLSLPGFSQQ